MLCFCYLGGFTVAMKQGDLEFLTHSVDLPNPCEERGQNSLLIPMVGMPLYGLYGTICGRIHGPTLNASPSHTKHGLLSCLNCQMASLPTTLLAECFAFWILSSFWNASPVGVIICNDNWKVRRLRWTSKLSKTHTTKCAIKNLCML